jgi:hypothetical protein
MITSKDNQSILSFLIYDNFESEMRPGTDVMIVKIFSPKNSTKKLAFLTQNKAKLCKI